MKQVVDRLSSMDAVTASHGTAREEEHDRAPSSDESARESDALARWLPQENAEPLNVAEVLRQLRDIEETVAHDRRNGPRRRWLPPPPSRQTPLPSAPPPPAVLGGPDIDDLLQKTLDSYPPPPPRRVDELFTGHSLYEDMRVAMGDSLRPMAISQPPAAHDDHEEPALPSPLAPKPPARRLWAFAAICVGCFGLGGLLSLSWGGGQAPAQVSLQQPWHVQMPELAEVDLRGALSSPLASEHETASSTTSVAATAATAGVLLDPGAAAAHRSAPPEANGPEPSPRLAAAEPTASAQPTVVQASAEDWDQLGPAADAGVEAGAEPESVAALPRPFDQAAAAQAASAAAARAAACADGQHKGRAQVHITFAPSGRVTSAVVAGSSTLAGTAVGSCIALAMRSAQVPPFDGELITVSKTVSIR